MFLESSESQDFKLPPSLVAVKAFQQTAGKTIPISGGEKCFNLCRKLRNVVLSKKKKKNEDSDNFSSSSPLPLLYSRPYDGYL